MAKCYREDCAAPATRQIRGIAMCDREYIEALEHGAHIEVTALPFWLRCYLDKKRESEK